MSTNKPGRPRVDRTDRSVPVSVVMPARLFDSMYHRAHVERVTVPEVIRRLLRNSANTKMENSG
jgi:hypothetical protein